MTYPTCLKCGNNHLGECLMGKEGCFMCVKFNHTLKDFASSKQEKRVTIIGVSL